ncbi:Vacuolar protein sorting-associated protein [Parasponia andersonii]|uniref:Vacuolar protein sorting-associated protein n=1 Tax=Parasponia andersonii TaxID=3476 RepID=A0A2P5CER8_PARAD|nr:Vacuolar protein sorting-associated protein [Parasponia andersonii]
MRNKINSLLGRSLIKTSKFKPLVSLAISRLAVLKNQRQVRSSQARSDVVQLLQLGHHDRALLRVEHVIKEQNMLDVYDMIEGYCNLLIERIHLIEHERVCPDELKEAISGLLYADSRCGDFPELHEIRAVLTSHFGKEIAARAIELRNNSGVNHTIIIKLSTRQPSLESRMKVLKEIASENSIALQLEEAATFPTKEWDVQKNQNQPAPNPSSSLSAPGSGGSSHILQEETDSDDRFSDSVKARKKYKDVADAAQAAFESAAYAAAAARAAVELSRPGNDSDNQDSPGSRRGKSTHRNEPMKMESDSEEEQIPDGNRTGELRRSFSSSSSEAITQGHPSGQDVVFDESDNETITGRSSMLPPQKQVPSRFQAGLEVNSVHQNSGEHDAAGSGTGNSMRLNLEKGPFSVRNRRVRGY